MFWALPGIFGTYSRPIRRGLGHCGPKPLGIYRFAPRATLSPSPLYKGCGGERKSVFSEENLKKEKVLTRLPHEGDRRREKPSLGFALEGRREKREIGEGAGSPPPLGDCRRRTEPPSGACRVALRRHNAAAAAVPSSRRPAASAPHLALERRRRRRLELPPPPRVAAEPCCDAPRRQPRRRRRFLSEPPPSRACARSRLWTAAAAWHPPPRPGNSRRRSPWHLAPPISPPAPATWPTAVQPRRRLRPEARAAVGAHPPRTASPGRPRRRSPAARSCHRSAPDHRRVRPRRRRADRLAEPLQPGAPRVLITHAVAASRAPEYPDRRRDRPFSPSTVV